MQTSHRLKNLRKQLSNDQALLLTRPADIIYFSEYDQFLVPEEREGFCLVTTKSVTVLHPSMSHFTKQNNIQYRNGFTPHHLAKMVRNSREDEKWSKLLVDESSLFLNEYRSLVEAVGDNNILAIDRSMIWKLRMIKSTSELKSIQAAANITTKVQNFARRIARVGITELELSYQIEDKFRQLGGWPLAFPTIVAFGKNSALPHHQPGSTKLEQEMAVLVDCGATVNGYCGDMTRSFWFGQNPPSEYLKISKSVQIAFDTAREVLKPGITAAKVDTAARKVIAAAGYNKNFIHTTGHGLGLEIHEPPSLNSQNPQILTKNMVITIEPGIYLEGKFGVRHEDAIVVK